MLYQCSLSVKKFIPIEIVGIYPFNDTLNLTYTILKAVNNRNVNQHLFLTN